MMSKTIQKAEICLVVPAFNAETTIGSCIRTIKNQTLTNFEVCIVDDGSTDSTYETALEEIGFDNRFSVVRAKNQGVSSARNIGIKNTSAPLIMFMDADDQIAQDHFEKLCDSYKSVSSDLVVCGYVVSEKTNKREVKPNFSEKINSGKKWILYSLENMNMMGYCWNKLYKRSIIEKNNLEFNKKVHSQEDLAFNLEYFKHTNNITFTDSCTYYYYYSQPKRKADYRMQIQNKLEMLRLMSINIQNLGLNPEENEDYKILVSAIYSGLYGWLKTEEDLDRINDEFEQLSTKYLFSNKNLSFYPFSPSKIILKLFLSHRFLLTFFLLKLKS